MEYFIMFAIWGLKEAYQSYVGYRAKNAISLEEQKIDIAILKTQLKNAVQKIDDLQDGINFIRNEKRKYRD